MLRISDPGIAFIAAREGFRAVAYDDATELPWTVSKRGVKTIGYGTTAADISPLPDRITEPAARRLFVRGLDVKYEPAVRDLFAKNGPLEHVFNQHVYDVLCSVAYNLGAGALPQRHSGGWRITPGFETLGHAILAGDLRAIARALPLYSNPGTSVHAGLLARRHAEAARLLQPMAPFEMFRRGERELIQRFDRLQGHTSRVARLQREDCQRRMLRQGKRIAQAASEDHGDWRPNRRRVRYDALVMRGLGKRARK